MTSLELKSLDGGDCVLYVNGVEQPGFIDVEFSRQPVETFSRDDARRFVPGNETVTTIRVRGCIVHGDTKIPQESMLSVA